MPAKDSCGCSGDYVLVEGPEDPFHPLPPDVLAWHAAIQARKDAWNREQDARVRALESSRLTMPPESLDNPRQPGVSSDPPEFPPAAPGFPAELPGATLPPGVAACFGGRFWDYLPPFGARDTHVLAKEFEPHVRPDANTLENGLNPASDQLLIAVSEDGVTWYKTGLIVAARAGVPCLIVADADLIGARRPRVGEAEQEGPEATATAKSEQALYLFYVRTSDRPGEEVPTPLAVASTTNLVDWVYRDVNINWGELNTELLWYPMAVDPSVIENRFDARSEFLLYATLFKQGAQDNGGNARPDHDTGRTFVFQNEEGSLVNWSIAAIEPVFPTEDGLKALDPNLLWMPDGACHYFAGGLGLGVNHDAWVVDFDTIGCWGTEGDAGCIWDRSWPNTEREDWATMMTNGLVYPDGETVYFAQVQPRGLQDFQGFIGQLAYHNGKWAPVQRALEVDRSYEYGKVMDAAVAYFRGCFVMVYNTGIPR